MGGYLMLQGGQTWKFPNLPTITSTGVVGGPFEKDGQLPNDFDKFHENIWMGQDTFEKGQRILIEDAVEIALQKRQLLEEDVQFFIAGDLLNQLTSSSYAARTNKIPYLGVFSACSTAAEGLAIAAFLVNAQGARHVLTGASSHHSATDKQYRYPTEYGSQKPPTAQWTVTGAGVGLVSTADYMKENQAPRVTAATIGRVMDMGLTDPFNLGGAMAPAAVDTIIRHLQDLQLAPNYYDLIVTGDLALIGRKAALALLHEKGIEIEETQFQDCGLMLYREHQSVQSGASGAGCCATVFYGHLLNQMKKGKFQRMLFVATGALHSPLTFQQKETIPCIAHAVAIEYQ